MSDTQYLHLSMKGLNLMGLWQNVKFDSLVTKKLHLLWGKFITYLVIIFNITQIVEMIIVSNDFMLLIENINVTVLYFLVTFKIGVLHFQWRKFDEIIDRIRDEEMRSLQRGHEEKNIYITCMNINNFMTKFFWYTGIVTVAAFDVGRPIEFWYNGPEEIHHYRMPFVATSWFPFDKYNDTNFPIAYFLNAFICAIGGVCLTLTDTLYIGLIIFGIGQYQMMQQAIKDLHLVKDENGNMVEMEQEDILDPFEEIVDIIKHHNRIIEYYKELDNVLKPVMFLKFLVTSVIICAVCLEGILAGPSIRLVIDAEYLIGLLIEVFSYYWFANEVILESVKMGSSVGDSKWFMFSPRVKKALLILQMRCKKPSKLTIGGFYDISLESFVVMMKSAYSFITLLLNKYQE